MKNHLDHHQNDFHLSFLNHIVIYQDHFIHHHRIMNRHFKFSSFLDLIHLNHPIKSIYLILFLLLLKSSIILGYHPMRFII